MSGFYDLPLDEQSERFRALAGRALALWGVEDCEPVLLKIRENAVFRVRATDGRDAVLRIHRYAYHTDEALRSELIWVEALRAAGIDVPAPIPTPDGALFATVRHAGVPEPRQVDMQSWMPGEALGTIEDGPNPAIADTGRVFAGVGRMAARFHNHTESWPLPAGFVRHAWDSDGLVGPEPLWGRFWESDALGGAEYRLVRRARERVAADLAAYGQARRRYGLIHADFNLDNLLLDGERIVALDFDDAGFGWHLFDLATVWTMFRGAPFYETLRSSVVAGYRDVRDLPDEELAHMPLFELARAFTYLGWVHTRRETATARAIAPDVAELVCTLADDYLAGRAAPPAPAEP